MTIIVPAGFVLPLAVVVLWIRQRMAIRRASVRAASPGCPKCLYLVRGWNSPVCPECGTDVRIAGVVTGVRIPRWLKMLAALMLTAAATIPLGTLLTRALFTYQASIEAYLFRSLGLDGGKPFDLDLRTVSTTWNLPWRTSMVTQLTLNPTASLGGINIHYQAEGWAPPVEGRPGDSAAWTTWTIEDDESVPTAYEIAVWMSPHLGVEDPLELSPHASELHSRMMATRGKGVAVPWQGAFFSSSSGTGNAYGIAPGAASVSLGLPALALALIALLVWRKHRPGWRAAHDGDWAGTLEVGGETSPALSRGDAQLVEPGD
jgi:hypothetical protein